MFQYTHITRGMGLITDRQDSTATSYVITCASPSASSTAAAASTSSISLDNFPYTVDSSDCGLSSAVTIVQGPSTVHFAMAIGDV